MKYYLDTAAVRRLSRSLDDLNGSCYTSIFTILELLSGIPEKEYEARKAATANLFRSSMKIDFRMPITVILEAFKIDEPNRGISSDDIKKVANKLVESISYQDFIKRNKELQPNINSLSYFDQKLSAEFKKVYSQKISDIRESRTTGKNSRFDPIKGKGIKALGDFICQKYLPVLSGTSAEVQKRYDGSIDVFLKVWLKYYDSNANQLNDPSTNDWSDVLHTTYLPDNRGFIFVSDDKKIRNLLNSIVVGSSISIDELKAL